MPNACCVCSYGAPVKTPQVMQESELLNTSEGKDNSQDRKFKKEKEVTAK